MRQRAATFFLGLLLIALSACGPERQPNVVIVTFDTTRVDRFGAYGDEDINTPVVDGLASEGVLFERSFSSAPVTAPSHSTILTGTYPTAHGVRDNGLFVLTENNTTIAEILKAEGYATAAAVASFPLDSQFGLDQGFDLYDDHFTPSQVDFLGRPNQVKPDIFFDERPAARVNEAVYPWLEAHHDEPFFIWLHYFDPHHPLQPPAPYDELYASDLYRGEIAYADESLGVFVERLRQLEVWDNTILVFTSDHGEGLGEHNETTHSTLVYNSTMHVPLVMRIPGGPQAVRVAQRVGTVDIVPTLLDLLGLEHPAGIQGRSLLPLLDAPSDTSRAPTQYAETLAPRFSHSWGELRVLFHRQFKYIFGPRPELYDIDADPKELDNLIDQQPDIAQGMHRQLEDFLAQHATQDPDSLMEVDPATRARLEALGYIQTDAGEMTINEILDGSGTPPQDRVGDVNDVSTAKHFLQNNNPAAAKELALKLLKRDPGNPFYLQLKASAELLMNDLDNALPTLDEIRRLDPNGLPTDTLILQLVNNLYYRGRGDEAIGILQDAQTVRPSALGKWSLASLLSSVGRKEEEIAVLREALELAPEFAPARVDLAVYSAQSGDLETAKREFERALADLPYYVKGHFNYATLHLQMGDLQTALKHYDRAVQLQPNYLNAHYARVSTALQLGDRQRAEDYLETLVQLAPESVEAQRAQELLKDSP